MSTIAAIATGPAAGGIGIIRLSGPASLSAARRVARQLPASLTPRHAYFTRFSDADGAVLDEGLLLYFQAPHSFTGEDVVELHAHGAPRLLSLLLSEVLREDDVRPATPGEFTRRAYLSGRIDLSRAEAVADLVAAESEAQVRAAAAQLSGELTARLEAVHAPLLELHADLEGSLDFPEEAEGADQHAGPRLDAALSSVQTLLADARRGALIRRGARVVLYGPVNAGKSTLFNALAGASRALVDAEPGTTRDTLEARLELAGLAVTLIDTAGLRETTARIEALGIGRTRDALAGADIGVLVLPPETTADQRAAWRAECDDARRIEVRGKADLLQAEDELICVSGQTGQGLERLRSALAARLGAGQSAAVLASSERHLAALEQVEAALRRAKEALELSTIEVVSGEVGLALEALTVITGEDASTALLDSIFARFCIGK
ncbi:MAG: tRNA uridine-5-carboxymethylaminomethyl(34) synthesis GTPase MnmE [Archangium sp.]|nr:tRNA uridine-5-carboxymethylaminomethyl(34) synthesis GTPase MnmE [Archangium sp.]